MFPRGLADVWDTFSLAVFPRQGDRRDVQDSASASEFLIFDAVSASRVTKFLSCGMVLSGRRSSRNGRRDTDQASALVQTFALVSWLAALQLPLEVFQWQWPLALLSGEVQAASNCNCGCLWTAQIMVDCTLVYTQYRSIARDQRISFKVTK